MGPRRGAWARSWRAVPRRQEKSERLGRGAAIRAVRAPAGPRLPVDGTPATSGLKESATSAYFTPVSPLPPLSALGQVAPTGLQFLRQPPHSIWIYGLGLILGFLAYVCVRTGLWLMRRRRLLDDLPTTPAASVFIGLVEVNGTAESPEPLTSPMVKKPCVLYQTICEEHYTRTRIVTSTDADGNTTTSTQVDSGWEQVGKLGDQQSFYLKDETGAVRVDPRGANTDTITWYSKQFRPRDRQYGFIAAKRRVSGSDQRRRYTELGIPLHSKLYVVGRAREREDAVAAEIAHDKTAEIFRITHKGEAAVVRAQSWGAFGFFVLGALLYAGLTAIFFEHLGPQAWIASGAVYPLSWLIGYGVSLRNSLIDLRDRCDRALSRLDIEFERRSTLIPRLVGPIEGLRDHEREVQTLVADMRAQVQAKGSSGRGLAPRLRVIAEAYPELKSNDTFLRLQEELVHTENRIAWVRGYLNSIQSAFNVRLERVPDRFLAGPMGFKRRALFATDDFERLVPKVELQGVEDSA